MNHASAIFMWGLWLCIYSVVVMAVTAYKQPAYLPLWKPWALAVLVACRWGLRIGVVLAGIGAGMGLWR